MQKFLNHYCVVLRAWSTLMKEYDMSISTRIGYLKGFNESGKSAGVSLRESLALDAALKQGGKILLFLM